MHLVYGENNNRSGDSWISVFLVVNHDVGYQRLVHVHPRSDPVHESNSDVTLFVADINLLN